MTAPEVRNNVLKISSRSLQKWNWVSQCSSLVSVMLREGRYRTSLIQGLVVAGASCKPSFPYIVLIYQPWHHTREILPSWEKLSSPAQMAYVPSSPTSPRGAISESSSRVLQWHNNAINSSRPDIVLSKHFVKESVNGRHKDTSGKWVRPC